MIRTAIKHYLYDIAINTFFDRLKSNFPIIKEKNELVEWESIKAGDVLKFSRYDEWFICIVQIIESYVKGYANFYTATVTIVQSNTFEPNEYYVHETEGWLIERWKEKIQ